MVFNVMDWPRDNVTPKVHPTQKPMRLMEYLIEIFTDPGDIVIDPLAGSGVTLAAAQNLGRRGYGFEIKKNFYRDSIDKILSVVEPGLFSEVLL